MAQHQRGLRRDYMEPRRNRTLLAATCFLAASLAVVAGELADGAVHAANAARKHLAGVKYEDVTTSKPTKRATGVVPQKSIGTRRR